MLRQVFATTMPVCTALVHFACHQNETGHTPAPNTVLNSEKFYPFLRTISFQLTFASITHEKHTQIDGNG